MSNMPKGLVEKFFASSIEIKFLKDQFNEMKLREAKLVETLRFHDPCTCDIKTTTCGYKICAAYKTRIALRELGYEEKE